MELPDPRAWSAVSVGKIGLLKNGIGYVFDIKPKHSIEFYPVPERNLDIKRGILEGIMDFDKTICGSVIKEDSKQPC